MQVTINPKNISTLKVAKWEVTDDERVCVTKENKIFSIIFDDVGGAWLEVQSAIYNDLTDEIEPGALEKRILVNVETNDK